MKVKRDIITTYLDNTGRHFFFLPFRISWHPTDEGVFFYSKQAKGVFQLKKSLRTTDFNLFKVGQPNAI